jgi:DNA-binding LacI/PurR family transcriptional regulator
VVDAKAPPSAVFFFDDHLARVFVEALSSHGLRVPQDLSIIGCNDDLLNQKNQGGFSTIHLPCAEIGARAFEELNRLAVEGRPKSSETIMLPVKYLDRGTLRSAG